MLQGGDSAVAEFWRGTRSNRRSRSVAKCLFERMKRDFAGYTDRRHAREDAVESLDQGKWFVLEGRDWLREELFGASHS